MQKEIERLLKEKYNGNLPAGRQGQKKFYKDVKRLEKAEPLDYVIGFTEFLGCKIDLSKKPLIPRPETEFWTEQAIKEIKKALGSHTSQYLGCMTSQCLDKRKLKVLDIFSGSGCIGIAILNHVKNSQVIFADKDKNALKQIRVNLKINKINTSLIRSNKGWTEREISVVVKSDIFGNIKGKFDYIFANPPYVATAKINQVQKSVLKYEPKLALFGSLPAGKQGKDGLFYIKKFLKDAKNHLNPGGKIFMEFSPEQKKQIEKLLKKYKYSHCEFHKDQYGKWRYVVIE